MSMIMPQELIPLNYGTNYRLSITIMGTITSVMQEEAGLTVLPAIVHELVYHAQAQNQRR